MHLPRGTLNFLGLNPTGDLGPLTAYTSRRHGTVWFPKAPPTTPPSLKQLHQRDRFRLAAEAWKEQTDETRNRWHAACRRAGLYVHGYNLWVWFHLTQRLQHLRTIERQSHVSLL